MHYIDYLVPTLSWNRLKTLTQTRILTHLTTRIQIHIPIPIPIPLAFCSVMCCLEIIPIIPITVPIVPISVIRNIQYRMIGKMTNSSANSSARRMRYIYMGYLYGIYRGYI